MTENEDFHYNKTYKYEKTYIFKNGEAFYKLFFGTTFLATGYYLFYACNKVDYGVIQNDIVFYKHVLMKDNPSILGALRDKYLDGQITSPPVDFVLKKNDGTEKIFHYHCRVECDTPQNFQLCENYVGPYRERFENYWAKIPKGTQIRTISNSTDLIRIDHHCGKNFESRWARAFRKTRQSKLIFVMSLITFWAGIKYFD